MKQMGAASTRTQILPIEDGVAAKPIPAPGL